MANSGFSVAVDHPRRSEAIDGLHGPGLGQVAEDALGFRGRIDVQRHREALRRLEVPVHGVGARELLAADLERRMILFPFRKNGAITTFEISFLRDIILASP